MELKNTHVPNSPQWLRGLVNLRGSLVPVIDLGIVFNIRDKTGHNVIILSIKGRIIGILVDSIGTIMDIREDELEKPPSTISKHEARYISGIKRLEKGLLVHLSPENLIGMGGKTSSYQEKRQHVRKALDMLAVYTIAYDNMDLQWQPCRVLDISIGGARLLVNEHLNIGTDINVRIKDDIELEGIVVSSNKSEDKLGEYVGIKFKTPPDVVGERIKKFMRDK